MPMIKETKTVRVLFQKSGRAVYISHLDLTRAMGRALARCGLPVWYTEGFHPHLYMTFALPLSLGTEGMCETMDFRLVEDVPLDEVAKRLDEALPEGLHAVRAWEPVMQPKEIFWADYEAQLVCDFGEVESAFAALAAANEVQMQKRSKKGIKTVDIRPLYSIGEVKRTSFGAAVSIRCRAGVETNLNPSLVLEAAEKLTGFSPISVKFRRVAVKDEKLCDFL